MFNCIMSAPVEPFPLDFVNRYRTIGLPTSLIPEQIEEMLSREINVDGEFQKICVCGMGASAIAGDIFTDYANEVAKKPVNVIRGVDLPHWVDSNTLALITSYSGETLETLELFRQALSCGTHVITISSGGKLSRMSQENGVLNVAISPGIQPRAAFGYIFGAISSIMDDLGICPARKELTRILPNLKDLRDSMMPDVFDNEAIELARSLLGTIPVVYGHPNMSASALRWKTQIHENAKMMSFSGIMPEFNHNEIVGWIEGDPTNRCSPVILYDTNASATLKGIVDTTVKSLRESGVEVHEVFIEGQSSLEKNLRSSLIGDFVSLYLAVLRNVDPEKVDPIVSLKKRLSHIFN